MFEINSMTLTITGRIGVTTLQITCERSVKKMDTGVIIGLAIAFFTGAATATGVVVTYMNHRHQKELEKLQYSPSVTNEVFKMDGWTRVHIIVKNRATFPIRVANIKCQGADFFYRDTYISSPFGIKFSEDAPQNHDLPSSSKEVSTVIPSSGSRKDEVSFVLLFKQPHQGSVEVTVFITNNLSEKISFVRERISMD